MAAHVHHGQDVLAGLAIGVVAALLAIALVRLFARSAWFSRLERHGIGIRRSGRPAPGHPA